MINALRLVAALAVLGVAAAALGASTAASGSGTTNPEHFFWAPGQSPSASVADSGANDRRRSTAPSCSPARPRAPARRKPQGPWERGPMPRSPPVRTMGAWVDTPGSVARSG